MDEKKKGPSIGEKIKEGVSVQELETFARKYTVEAFFILAIIIGSISSIFGFFTGAGWSIAFAGLGAIASVAFPESIIKFEKTYYAFVAKYEKTTQIAVGIIWLVIALFVPFILFAQIGLLSGIAFHHLSHKTAVKGKKEEESPKESEEEHL